MILAIHGRPLTDSKSLSELQNLFNLLAGRSCKVEVFQPFYNSLLKKGISLPEVGTYCTREEFKKPDFVLSIGGDGTLLESVTYVGPKNIPILGINTGRLGFLATTPKENINSAVEAIFNKDFTINERTLIELDEGEGFFDGVNFGLNEFTILKRDTSSMIVVHTYIDGDYLNSYWADGLIISTPTGSTGYNLSCGGPLVMPKSNNFIISPVSPHNLNVRPMVVSDDSVISFEIESRNKKFLISLDSRSKSVPVSTKLSVRKCRFKAKLVQLDNYNYLETLRSKLNWGLDMRN
ncbi:NAD kinase [Cytophagaceae bacterium ABcell3]|nr:NAD kinase [Cytophagaceae bacterium ABcell3]